MSDSREAARPLGVRILEKEYIVACSPDERSELLDSADSDQAKRALTQRMEDVEAHLKPSEDGEMFIQQIQTAGRVFGKGIFPVPT